MRSPRFTLIAYFLCMSFAASGVFAAVDTNAAVVQLRKSCQEVSGTLNNCFTNLATLNSWIWNIRNPQPSAAAPLLVEIGPGVFTGQFNCTNKGYVTLRGTGMQNTIIEGANGGDETVPIATTNCVNLTFSHMTLRNIVGVYATQSLGGSTYWDNVEIDALGYAWIDSLTYQCIGVGKHYWFNSRIIARTAFSLTKAYYNVCDESWFFGSEITAVGSAGSTSVVSVFAHGGEVHIYGSVIRAMTNANVVISELVAAQSINNAKIHIHGTGIDVISPAANNIVALKASNSSEIHANASSYNLSTGAGGSVKRLSKNNDGHIHAPYLWEHIPTAPNFTSLTGADMATITNTSDNHPHLVIYDSSCTNKWFDTTTNACM